jgi:hypothetical protein
MRNSILRAAIAAAVMAYSGSMAMADEQRYALNIAAGTCRPLPLPSVDGAVHILGKTTVSGGDPGVADVTIFRDNVDGVLMWVAMDSTSSSVIHGNGSANGTHIATLDLGGNVNLEVQNLGHVMVCNTFSGPSIQGAMTFFW